MMAKHDSWVYLTCNSPFEDIIQTFPDGFPVRDPFPMVLQQTSHGSVVPCWTLDLNRMSSTQVVLVASVFAAVGDVEIETAIAKLHREGAHLSYRWVESLECGPEGRARTAEIREFFAAYPDPLPSQLLYFYKIQKQKWVEGNEKPEPELMVSEYKGRLQWVPQKREVNRI
jgi:hypothetical protein